MDKFIAALVAITVVAVVAITAWALNANATRDNNARMECITSGGVWTNNVCAWSKS
jgi:cyanate permease